MAVQPDITQVRGACPHDCPDTCATITEVRDGRAVRFYAQADHPVTQGWLCAKVRPYLERVYHPDRVLYPLRRVGPKGGGQWERVSWDAAIAEIAERWRAIVAEHGGAAILPYSYSGTLGMLQLGIVNARLWNRMGASGLERSICGAAAERAVEATYGARWAPDPADVLKVLQSAIANARVKADAASEAFDERELVVDVDGPNYAARDAGFVGNRADDVGGAHAA